MSKDKGRQGFKNEVTRVRKQVPEVLKDYPEKRFWRMIDAPLTSRSYLKFYFYVTAFMTLSYGVGGWLTYKYNLMNHKIFEGTYKQESDLIDKFPDLDRDFVYKQQTFAEKYKQREKERIEQLRAAKKKRDEEQKRKEEEKSKSTVKQSNSINNQATKDVSQKSKE